jgi:hypothetical protein
MTLYPPPAPRQPSVAGTVLKVIGTLALIALGLCFLAVVAFVVAIQLT